MAHKKRVRATPFSVLLSPELSARLEAFAKRDHRTKSNVIAMALEQFLDLREPQVLTGETLLASELAEIRGIREKK